MKNAYVNFLFLVREKGYEIKGYEKKIREKYKKSFLCNMYRKTKTMNEIQRLAEEKSGSTTLISLYLKGLDGRTGSKESASWNQKITKELSAAENIKSESTRKEVLSNLRAIQRNLKELQTCPEKGLAIFSGNGLYI